MSARLQWVELTRRNKTSKLHVDHLTSCRCRFNKWGRIALKHSRRESKGLEEEAGDVVGLGMSAAGCDKAAELALAA